MSIVSVHGPLTFGSKGVVSVGEVSATPSPANALIWNFKLSQPSDRPAADFDWAFPGGTPATQADSKGPVQVTYAAAGSKTATLTVSGAGGDPANGSYPITVTAAAGAAPRELLQEADEEEEDVYAEGVYRQPEEAEAPEAEAPEAEAQVSEDEAPDEYDPGDYTVAEVVEHAETLSEEEIRDLIDTEAGGKNRSTLVQQLQELLPFDPGDYTVAEVLDYADENPDDVQAIYNAEAADKGRTTLLEGLVDRGAAEGS